MKHAGRANCGEADTDAASIQSVRFCRARQLPQASGMVGFTQAKSYTRFDSRVTIPHHCTKPVQAKAGSGEPTLACLRLARATSS